MILADSSSLSHTFYGLQSTVTWSHVSLLTTEIQIELGHPVFCLTTLAPTQPLGDLPSAPTGPTDPGPPSEINSPSWFIWSSLTLNIHWKD